MPPASPAHPAPPIDLASSTVPTADGRYARQALFAQIGGEGQRALGRTAVVLVGCGALGSAVAGLLVRAGIGRLTIIDRDYVELSNLQRQSLFDEDDVAAHLPKAATAAEKLRRANSAVEVIPVVADANAANIEGLAEGADFLVDGLDNFATRYLLNDVAVKHGLPWVYGGVIASYGMTMTVRPGLTPCLRCVFPEPPAPGSAPTCDTAGVIGPAVDLIAAIQSAEVLKLAVGDRASLNTSLLSIDVWRLAFDRIPLGGPVKDCPACGQRAFAFLDRTSADQTTSLCGHDAVQVLAPSPVRLDLPALADRLSPLGSVTSNRFLIRFVPADRPVQVTVFPDGRAIIKGTTEGAEARSLYARYVGT